ncbi:MAG: LemA family protein [Patescibacteria group bacterium]
MEIIYFLVFLGLLLFIIGVGSYNSLISLKNRVKEAFSDMDVQMKRRYDLIPNLVSTVKGAAKFEQETLEKVIQARQQAIKVSTEGSTDGMPSAQMLAAEQNLTGSLRQLFAVAESYPDLKSNQNFLALQQELSITEDKILSSRRFYNGVVSNYNASQDQFPTMLFKSLAGAKQEPFFELENPTEERKNVKVEF